MVKRENSGAYMMWGAGMIQRLEVARDVSPYRYFLTNGKEDGLLH